MQEHILWEHNIFLFWLGAAHNEELILLTHLQLAFLGTQKPGS